MVPGMEPRSAVYNASVLFYLSGSTFEEAFNCFNYSQVLSREMLWMLGLNISKSSGILGPWAQTHVLTMHWLWDLGE